MFFNIIITFEFIILYKIKKIFFKTCSANICEHYSIQYFIIEILKIKLGILLWQQKYMRALLARFAAVCPCSVEDGVLGRRGRDRLFAEDMDPHQAWGCHW